MNEDEVLSLAVNHYELAKNYKKLEQENKILIETIKAELKRCGGTVPILGDALREIEGVILS